MARALRTYQHETAAFRGNRFPLIKVPYSADDRIYTVYLDTNFRGSQVFVPPGGSFGNDTMFFVMHIDRMNGTVDMELFDLDPDRYDRYQLWTENIKDPITPINWIFLEDWKVEDFLGPKGLDYSDMYIAKKLAYYLEETAY